MDKHNGGLSKFDPYTGNFTNFTVKDGLQGDEFNQGSCFKSSSGELILAVSMGLPLSSGSNN